MPNEQAKGVLARKFSLRLLEEEILRGIRLKILVV